MGRKKKRLRYSKWMSNFTGEEKKPMQPEKNLTLDGWLHFKVCVHHVLPSNHESDDTIFSTNNGTKNFHKISFFVEPYWTHQNNYGWNRSAFHSIFYILLHNVFLIWTQVAISQNLKWYYHSLIRSYRHRNPIIDGTVWATTNGKKASFLFV